VVSLLEQFLKEEANSHVRGLLLGAVGAHKANPDAALQKFEFNRFEITLDFLGDMALIEDVLGPTPSGEVRFELGEFVNCVSQNGSSTGPAEPRK